MGRLIEGWKEGGRERERERESERERERVKSKCSIFCVNCLQRVLVM